jgi:ABC-2 type transport system permease protein
VRVHALIARLAFRRHATYRGAMLGGVIANTVFGIVQAFILTAVWKQRPSINGYDLSDALTYNFIAQAMIGPMMIFGGLDLAERIRTGDVATDLFRPIDFQTYWLSQDLGRAAFAVIGRGIVPFAVGALLFPLRIPADPRVWAALAVAVFFGVCVSFALRYLVALSAFWLLDERGVAGAMGTVTSFFSGLVIPTVLFPTGLRELAQVLPFASLVQVPVDVFLGKRSGGSLASAYLFEIGWAVVLLALGRLVTGRARLRVVTQGG